MMLLMDGSGHSQILMFVLFTNYMLCPCIVLPFGIPEGLGHKIPNYITSDQKAMRSLTGIALAS